MRGSHRESTAPPTKSAGHTYLVPRKLPSPLLSLLQLAIKRRDFLSRPQTPSVFCRDTNVVQISSREQHDRTRHTIVKSSLDEETLPRVCFSTTSGRIADGSQELLRRHTRDRVAVTAIINDNQTLRLPTVLLIMEIFITCDTRGRYLGRANGSRLYVLRQSLRPACETGQTRANTMNGLRHRVRIKENNARVISRA